MFYGFFGGATFEWNKNNLFKQETNTSKSESRTVFVEEILDS